MAQLQEEDHTKSSFGVPSGDFQEAKGTTRQSSSLLSLHSGTSLDVGKEHSSKMLFSPPVNRAEGKAKTSTRDESSLLGGQMSERAQDEVRKSASCCHMEASDKTCRQNGFQRPLGDGSEKERRSSRKKKTLFSDCR